MKYLLVLVFLSGCATYSDGYRIQQATIGMQQITIDSMKYRIERLNQELERISAEKKACE